jgi:hypothetical protein
VGYEREAPVRVGGMSHAAAVEPRDVRPCHIAQPFRTESWQNVKPEKALILLDGPWLLTWSGMFGNVPIPELTDGRLLFRRVALGRRINPIGNEPE